MRLMLATEQLPWLHSGWKEQWNEIDRTFTSRKINDRNIGLGVLGDLGKCLFMIRYWLTWL